MASSRWKSTGGDLQTLVTDLQGDNFPVQPLNQHCQHCQHGQGDQGALTLSVYVSSDYGSGSIELAGDGTIKRLSLPNDG